jgi:hypothetical protein
MARRMRDKDFRDDQWARRYTGRVARINRFIDELDTKDDAGHPPYIPPTCGGVDALALSISRDPGPKAGGMKGSGFLSIENDDASAERMAQFLDQAGINYAQVVPWNAYPWYINSDPTTEQLQAGVEPLSELIGLMPNLRVVILHGSAADKGWKLFLRQDLGLIQRRGIVWLSTYHTSRQALQTRTGSSVTCAKPASATPSPSPQRSCGRPRGPQASHGPGRTRRKPDSLLVNCPQRARRTVADRPQALQTSASHRVPEHTSHSRQRRAEATVRHPARPARSGRRSNAGQPPGGAGCLSAA